jgi:hypothetical protein
MGDQQNFQQMREFIYLTEQQVYADYADLFEQQVGEPLLEEQQEVFEHPILHDCRELVFKLRAFMESEGGDYAMGVETGMQRAAEMVENIIRRYEKGDDE